jgi:hypothetical protein
MSVKLEIDSRVMTTLLVEWEIKEGCVLFGREANGVKRSLRVAPSCDRIEFSQGFGIIETEEGPVALLSGRK